MVSIPVWPARMRPVPKHGSADARKRFTRAAPVAQGFHLFGVTSWPADPCPVRKRRPSGCCNQCPYSCTTSRDLLERVFVAVHPSTHRSRPGEATLVLRPEATHRSRPREATLVRRISRALDKKTSLRPPHRVCAPRNDQKAANPAKPARGACNPTP
jgi:hypothetical protein